MKTVIRPETEMNDSGVAYIEKIPTDWIIRKGKTLYSVGTGKLDANAEDINGLYPFFTCSMYPKRINTYAFDCEALMVAGNGIVGFTQYFNGKFNAYQRTYVLSNFKMILPIYLKYYVSSRLIDAVAPNSVGSVIQFIKLGDLQNFCVVMPRSELEQQAIVDYLDATCSKIDEIIAEAKASIDEYKKLRIAAVNDAVTHGIHHNAVKDSNVDWIGKIPDNWKIIITKRLFKIKKDIAGKEGYTVLSITQKGIVPKVFGGKGQFAADYSNYQLVNKGDFAMNHMDLITGWLDISEYDGVTSPDYRVFVQTGYEDIYAPYYKYVMQNCYSCRIYYGLGHGVAGAGRWRLPADMFLNFKLPMPPKAEQEEIADFLDKRTAEIDSLIAEKESLINDLEAYKKSLIYEVVTGKRRVV